ncbi:hypothetical protein [Abditibacterium utsteinense]|nr:hypothetical protein [Abditibacterium utsteinense]
MSLTLLLWGGFKSSIAAPALTTAPLPTFQGLLGRQWHWINNKWTDNDKPYLQVRSQISPLWRAKRMNRKELKRLKQLSLQRPADNVARFRWAYYTYCFLLLQSNRDSVSGEIGDVSQAFSANPTPNSYQYGRLRFLIACSPGGSAGFPYGNGLYLKQLGERLLRRDTKDERVKTYQIDNLMTGQPQDERKSLRYAQDLVKANPKDASAYITLGWVCQYTYVGRRSKDGRQQAINAYQKALALNKTPGKWRDSALSNIRRLQKI